MVLHLRGITTLNQEKKCSFRLVKMIRPILYSWQYFVMKVMNKPSIQLYSN